MERREPSTIVAANIAAAADAAGVQMESVDPRVQGSEITFGDLLDISGVLHVTPASLLQGVPSA